jgi:hypothetical protein
MGMTNLQPATSLGGRTAHKYLVPYWWFLVGMTAAVTVSMLAVVMLIPPHSVPGDVVVMVVALWIWRGVGWSIFYQVTLSGDVVECRAVFRRVTFSVSTIDGISPGSERTRWRSRSRRRFFAIHRTDGRSVEVMAGKGFHNLVEVLQVVGPELNVADDLRNDRIEEARGRSGFHPGA